MVSVSTAATLLRVGEWQGTSARKCIAAICWRWRKWRGSRCPRGKAQFASFLETWKAEAGQSSVPIAPATLALTLRCAAGDKPAAWAASSGEPHSLRAPAPACQGYEPCPALRAPPVHQDVRRLSTRTPPISTQLPWSTIVFAVIAGTGAPAAIVANAAAPGVAYHSCSCSVVPKPAVCIN